MPTHVCSRLRLYFSLPFSGLKAALRRWQICQCQQTAVFAAAGSGHTHSVTHTHAAHTHSAVGIFIRDGKTPIHPNYCFFSSAGVCSFWPLWDPVTLQSPYTTGQNAGTTPLVYSPPTQPMNAQPQSRPVSAYDFKILACHTSIEMHPYCQVLCCCLQCGLWWSVGAAVSIWFI